MDPKPVHGLVGLCLVGLFLLGCQNSRPKPLAQGPGLSRNSLAQSNWSNNAARPGLAGQPSPGATNPQGPLSIPGNPSGMQQAGASQLTTNPTPGLPVITNPTSGLPAPSSNSNSNYLGTKPGMGDSSFPRTPTQPADFQSSVSPMKSPITTASMPTMPGGPASVGNTPVSPTGMHEVSSSPQPKAPSLSALESTPMPPEGPGLTMPGGS